MSEELSRDALLIYLENLRTLETIIYETTLSYVRIEERMDKNKKMIEESENDAPVIPRMAPLYEDKLVKSLIGDALFFIIGMVGVLIGAYGENRILGYLGGLSAAGSIVAFVIIGSRSEEVKKHNVKAVADYKKAAEEYREREKEYSRLLARNAEVMSREKAKEEELKKLLTDDYGKAQEQLDKAYSVNIIPSQFRNIQGIYYLYDYISTSSQGLSEALMQCNLEAIKQKLDNVIQLQGKAIIQQAQADIAIMKQNQKILETAQATMQNTAVAAKYTQIAAVNSALALQLASEQLAYQKANFWLK